MLDDELAKEVRVPFKDTRYDRAGELFQDDQSIQLFNLLVNSKTYENVNDTYEIIPYRQIKEWYYYREDYWITFGFDRNHPGQSATVIDCGAYIGDSVLNICESIPEKDIYYYALEPLNENAEIIRSTEVFYKKCAELHVLEYGAGEKDEKLYFHLPEGGETGGGKFTDQEEGAAGLLEIRKLDDLEIDYRGTLYIKMDIEGSELQALKGAEATIKKHRPFLAVCLYHRKNDLIEIPLYIKSLGVEYDYYLRGGYHTILWAIPK